MREYIFNLNSYIAVKLTDIGEAELKRQHEEFNKLCPQANIGEYSPRRIDKDGYTKFQGWDLMSKFGHMMWLCKDLPFELDVKIDVDEEKLQ